MVIPMHNKICMKSETKEVEYFGIQNLLLEYGIQKLHKTTGMDERSQAGCCNVQILTHLGDFFMPRIKYFDSMRKQTPNL